MLCVVPMARRSPIQCSAVAPEYPRGRSSPPSVTVTHPSRSGCRDQTRGADWALSQYESSAHLRNGKDPDWRTQLKEERACRLESTRRVIQRRTASRGKQLAAASGSEVLLQWWLELVPGSSANGRAARGVPAGRPPSY